MNKKIFILSHNVARNGACEFIKTAPENYLVEIREPTRNLQQNALIHSLVAQIARTCEFNHQKLTPLDWKRLLLDAYGRIKAAEGEPLKGWGRVFPSLDHSGVVQLGIQSRSLSISQASEFVSYLYAWGADNDVEWSDKNGF